jgi:hypothetical protein
MGAKYFTVDEANSLLPVIRPYVAELLERRAKVARARPELGAILDSAGHDVGGRVASGLVQEFIIIERLARQVRALGCIVRDLNTGLIDFLSERDGREVFLCWRYGEPRVEFYHELHTGFMSRQRIS